MDDGERLLEDHFYTSKERAESICKKLYNDDIKDRRDRFGSDNSLRESFEKEIREGYTGNLNPTYRVTEINVNEM